MWYMALQSWAAAKTSGIGYSLNYAGNKLGGALILNFQPFFLPSYAERHRMYTEESNHVEEPEVGHEILESSGSTEVRDTVVQEKEATVVDVESERDVEMSVMHTRQKGVVQSIA